MNKLKDLIESKNSVFNFIEKIENKDIIKFDKPTNKLYELIINSNDINIFYFSFLNIPFLLSIKSLSLFKK